MRWYPGPYGNGIPRAVEGAVVRVHQAAKHKPGVVDPVRDNAEGAQRWHEEQDVEGGTRRFAGGAYHRCGEYREHTHPSGSTAAHGDALPRPLAVAGVKDAGRWRKKRLLRVSIPPTLGRSPATARPPPTAAAPMAPIDGYGQWPRSCIPDCDRTGAQCRRAFTEFLRRPPSQPLGVGNLILCHTAGYFTHSSLRIFMTL